MVRFLTTAPSASPSNYMNWRVVIGDVACFQPRNAHGTDSANHLACSWTASPHGLMISVAPQLRPAWRITPAGTAKA